MAETERQKRYKKRAQRSRQLVDDMARAAGFKITYGDKGGVDRFLDWMDESEAARELVLRPLRVSRKLTERIAKDMRG